LTAKPRIVIIGDMTTPLEQAIAAAGSVPQLAARINRKPNVVWNWLKRGKVAAGAVLDVEAATGVSRHALRADVFGDGED
jgi:DNA-binding transcriptional regulator YdaS (Cro superfamily)